MKNIILFLSLQFSALAFAQAGSLDNSFNPGTGAKDIGLDCSALQPDGKVVIGGTFTSFNGVTRNRIARLNSNGSVDMTFNPGMGATGNNKTVSDLAIQSDGKIIIVGDFSGYNGKSRNNIARLNADGSIDDTFKVGAGFDNHTDAVVVQPDGKILVGGIFNNYNGTKNNELARLNTDGSLDTSFNTGLGVEYSVTTIALQPDGKIIIGGSFSSYNGVARRCIARLNTDGSLDASFNPGNASKGTYGASLTTIVVQPDGKIITGSYVNKGNGPGEKSIARLNADGSLDKSFVADAGCGSVQACVIQPDGKIFVGGLFRNFSCSTDFYTIVRLNADGTFDKCFNFGTGTFGEVESILLQPDGKILICGLFSTYNDITRPSVARLNIDLSPPKASEQSFCDDAIVANLVAKGTDVKWYTTATGGSALASNAVLSTGTYYVSQMGIGCESESDRTAVPVVIKEPIVSTFTPIGPICSGTALVLPKTSDNNITGTWSPVMNNTATTNYTFTPSVGSCATTTTMTVEVNPIANPSFTAVNPICSGTVPPALPTISNNNITGAWSPALDNTKTTAYTFTPTAGLCATTANMTIAVNPIVTPTFTQLIVICSGETLAALAPVSNNDITGTWSPALDNTKTTVYTFMPMEGECATPANMTITVKPIVTTQFTQINPICSGTALELPLTSDNGVTGSWSPAVNNTATTNYTFTPSAESCGTTAYMTVAVIALPDIDADYTKIICSGNDESVQLNAGLLSGSQSDYTYEWYKNDKLFSQSYNLTVKAEGVYTCKVKDKKTGCQNSRINTVVYSESVMIEDVIISDLTENNSITVMASGDPEYSLDNPSGPFQDSNVFENVEAGIHIVYVNDKKGCGLVSKTIAVVGAPPFFTPNGDGVNDRWKLNGVNAAFYKNSTVDIFDRYEKLLKVLSDAESDGWDGTYNGHPQPSDDYWFVINMEDGRVVKGHFSLKR